VKTTVSLTDPTLFEISIGERVLKKDVFNSKGKIPLYSANVFKPFGKVEKGNISDFGHDCILWGIDGNFEFNIIRKGNPFATTDHCGTIRILNDGILPEYLVYRLEQTKHEYGFDRFLRASLKNMGNVTVDVPTLDGEFDRAEQEKLVEKYTFVKQMKSDIAEKLTELRRAVVELGAEPSHRTVDVGLGDERFFKLQRGQRITQKDCDDHKGSIPVVSGRGEKDSYLGHVSEDWLRSQGIPVYHEPMIVIAANGSVGSVFIRDEPKYTVHDDALGVIPQTPELVPEYVRYALRNAAAKSQFQYNAKLYQKRLKALSIPVPAKPDGSIDRERQEELAATFDAIDALKGRLSVLSEAFEDKVVVAF
jgi:hypothetical protein